MNFIKYAHPDGRTTRVEVCQPSFARMRLTRTTKLGIEVSVPLPHPTVAQADRAMYRKGFKRAGLRRRA